MAAPSITEMKVGDFTINVSGHIGSGAMGVVHPARDATGKDVAAKRICGKDQNKMVKITRDLDRLLKLKHSSIVKFYDVKQIGSSVWIFMEFCPYQDLGEFFRKRQLTERQKLDIMIQMAQGVEYLHKNNIIHRAIKPSNILISSDNPIIIKLTDFDFSKFLEDDCDTSLMTSNVGTPAFKAPEFFQRNEERKIHYHRNVDIYALGLTFLAMIQQNKGLVPRIETPVDDSELYLPIGRLIAERIRYNNQQLDVIPGAPITRTSFLDRILGRRRRVSEEFPTDQSIDVSKELRKLIRCMTFHVPSERVTASEVLWDLQIIEMDLPRHVYLRHLGTHDTGLQHWGYSQFTVMESGLVVLWGKTRQRTPAAFHLYLKNTSAGWKKHSEVRALCEHEECARMDPVHIEEKELLAVSCSRCHMIRLLDTESKAVTVAFLNERFRPGSMSKGEGEVLYAMHLVNNQSTSVVQLESGKVPFKGPKQIVHSGLVTSYSVCYIPHPYKLLVFTLNKNPGLIRAVSEETGRKVWQTEGMVDEIAGHPHGMQFSQHHQVLLVADGINCRILVLHPKDGSYLQTIQLKPEMHAIVHLHLNQDELIVHHTAERKEKVSFFSLS